MKKKFLLVVCGIITAWSSASAFGYIITSCGISVPTVGPEAFETEKEWIDYLDQTNQDNCPGTTGKAIFMEDKKTDLT